MKVCIYDNAFLALQNHALEHGHEVEVFVPGVPMMPSKDFHCAEARGKMKQLENEEELLDVSRNQGWGREKKEKLIVVSHWAHEFYDRLKAYDNPDIPMRVVGSSNLAKMWETDRALGQLVIQGLSNSIPMKPIFQRKFEDRKEALAYAKTKTSFVVKEHPSTKGSGSATLTTIVNTKAMHQLVMAELGKQHNAWWPESETHSGCVIEDYVQGQEIAFSAFFNGKCFVFPVIANVEQKDAQEDNRTGILTGEVGSTFEAIWPSKVIEQFFTEITPYLIGQHCGMVDANFLWSKKKLWFMEFTIRFGRPTLENQIAMVEGRDLVQQMHDAITKDKAFTYRGPIGVAHTLYHYGYPLLQKFPEDLLLKTINKPRFQLPKSTSKVRFTPFFSLYQKGAWEGLVTDGRYAIVMGIGKKVEEARAEALAALTKIRIPEVTWRTDVGTTHAQVMKELRAERIVV